MKQYDCQHCGATRDDTVRSCPACGKHKHLDDGECDHDCEWCDSVAFHRWILDRASTEAFIKAVESPAKASPALKALFAKPAPTPFGHDAPVAQLTAADAQTLEQTGTMPDTKIGPYSLQGISLGGIYTSIYVPEL